jgi:hypothetical protein
MPGLKKEVWIERYSQSEKPADILIWIYQHNSKLVQAWVLEMIQPQWVQALMKWTFRSKKDLMNKLLEELEFYGDLRDDMKRKLLLAFTDQQARAQLLEAADRRIEILRSRKEQLDRDLAEVETLREESLHALERMQMEFTRLGKISERKRVVAEQLAGLQSHLLEVGELTGFGEKIDQRVKSKENEQKQSVVESPQGAE